MRRTHSKKASKKAAAKAPRQHGTATRQHILEVAGQVFAERGYADATSKEICERAGTNLAAVNYHFGSKDELYYAVLLEAHRQLGTIEELTAVANLKTDRHVMFEAFADLIARTLDNETSWQLQVFLREILSPSPLRDRMEQSQAIPKMKIYRGLVADLMQLPVDHPAVAITVINLMAPPMLLLLGHPHLTQVLFPDLTLTREKIARYALPFAAAGLDAISEQVRAELKSQAPSTPATARRTKPPGKTKIPATGQSES